MPYIKQELRPEFDKIITPNLNCFNGMFNAVSDIVSVVNQQELKNQDGCMNYVLSQLFLKVDTEFAEVISSLAIIQKYMLPDVICYFNIERARGLLECMMTEFMNRQWYERDNGHDMYEAHKRMIGHIKFIYAQYEKDKLTENGDLE